MFPSSRRVSAVLLAGTLTPYAFAAHTHLPTTSIWTLNLAESDFGGGPSMRSDTFVMVTDTEKRGRFLDHMVDSDGRPGNSPGAARKTERLTR